MKDRSMFFGKVNKGKIDVYDQFLIFNGFVHGVISVKAIETMHIKR